MSQQQHQHQQPPQSPGATGLGLGLGAAQAAAAGVGLGGAISPPLQSPTGHAMSSCDTDLDAEEELDDPKSPHSASSLSETFDWWFNKPKRNSKKSRYLFVIIALSTQN